MKPSRKLEKAHTNLALENCNIGLQLDKANARIAELTTEVADLKAKLAFVNAMNADQDKTVAELTDEVARYRVAFEQIDSEDRFSNEDDTSILISVMKITRNALKEGSDG